MRFFAVFAVFNRTPVHTLGITRTCGRFRTAHKVIVVQFRTRRRPLFLLVAGRVCGLRAAKAWQIAIERFLELAAPIAAQPVFPRPTGTGPTPSGLSIRASLFSVIGLRLFPISAQGWPSMPTSRPTKSPDVIQSSGVLLSGYVSAKTSRMSPSSVSLWLRRHRSRPDNTARRICARSGQWPPAASAMAKSGRQLSASRLKSPSGVFGSAA